MRYCHSCALLYQAEALHLQQLFEGFATYAFISEEDFSLFATVYMQYIFHNV